MEQPTYKAYREFGLEPSDAYVEACRRLRAAFIADGAYERPAKPTGQMRDNASRGSFVVLGEDGIKRGRAVREHWDKMRHTEEAAGVKLPTRAERSGYRCRADTIAAINFCLGKGKDLPGWRRKQRCELTNVRKLLGGSICATDRSNMDQKCLPSWRNPTRHPTSPCGTMAASDC